jgi:hypothetical protein
MPKGGQALLENARVQEFLCLVRSQCRKCNVKFVLADAEFVGGKSKQDQMLGFFWEPSLHRRAPGELRVATKNIPVSEWIVTLAHEYAHFLQWFRDDPVYNCDSYLEMEIATEREAFEILKQFGIPINYEAAKRKSKKYIAKIKRYEKEENTNE